MLSGNEKYWKKMSRHWQGRATSRRSRNEKGLAQLNLAPYLDAALHSTRVFIMRWLASKQPNQLQT
jgi:hypothetical protein